MPRYEWYRISDIPVKSLLEGDETVIRQSKTEGKNLCLIRHKGKIFALSTRCPHSGGPLAEGRINEHNQIVCPWHRFAFDLETGNSDSGGYFVETYEIKIENRGLWVKLKKRGFWF
ncbi:MAG: Rieske (2Fe-2S) protein [Bacteroidia bacterium]|nr:Rieske (2Fe-2S) protein [Bacteroidia bacterium]